MRVDAEGRGVSRCELDRWIHKGGQCTDEVGIGTALVDEVLIDVVTASFTSRSLLRKNSSVYLKDHLISLHAHESINTPVK